jgi:hypothetical protein
LRVEATRAPVKACPARWTCVLLDGLTNPCRVDLLISLHLVQRTRPRLLALKDIKTILLLSPPAVELDTAVVLSADNFGDQSLKYLWVEVMSGSSAGFWSGTGSGVTCDRPASVGNEISTSSNDAPVAAGSSALMPA